MRLTLALLLGAALDLLLGDPPGAPHPVRLIGRWISLCEGALRRLLPATPRGELAGGLLLVVLVAGPSAALAGGAVALAGFLHPLAALAAETLLCYWLLAGRDLRDHSRRVYDALRAGDLPGARAAVSMIVGRDTARLDESGVVRAAVETVAENACDGVVGPLLFFAAGGAPLGFFYKAVSTMDSTVGYKNERYLYFGRAAARLDDLLNLIPARLTALLMALTAPLCGLDAAGALRVWRRDGRKHASPNSAQSEAACAGALGVALAGDAWYFGRLCRKPAIGDAGRPVEAADILCANRLMLAAAGAALLLCAAARLILI